MPPLGPSPSSREAWMLCEAPGTRDELVSWWLKPWMLSSNTWPSVSAIASQWMRSQRTIVRIIQNPRILRFFSLASKFLRTWNHSCSGQTQVQRWQSCQWRQHCSDGGQASIGGLLPKASQCVFSFLTFFKKPLLFVFLFTVFHVCSCFVVSMSLFIYFVCLAFCYNLSMFFSMSFLNIWWLFPRFFLSCHLALLKWDVLPIFGRTCWLAMCKPSDLWDQWVPCWTIRWARQNWRGERLLKLIFVYGGFHKWGTPSYHPFLFGFSMIFPEINHPWLGTK